ncbi:hypothetical protein HYH02_003887 [Chlamydomonas schloesseri]|uniref:Wax synthase domain-containing protein n=1 Tax=Chlamydomonas schloesseri TaxID=2026947 RepID=A0A836B8Y2_9CHLO|nr:hypothetical protein HYH02_003887 [Chlamydomonas schloesseri]|eukprot:KAG2451281.1 hypothetical protein HYH02_003887 [Chlamydomonas schloesseri]
MASWALTVLGLGLTCVGAAAMSRSICLGTAPGLLRLLLLLPAAALFVTAPLAFEVQSASRASAAAMLMWLATFKLLALGCGRGPLAVSLRQLSLGQFTALLLWPVIPVTVVTLVAVYTLTHPAVPLFPKTYSAAFGVCAYCSLWANVCAALVAAVHGLVLAPSWNRPWLQTSLADFWGRRWNLPAAASLKHLVYAPVVEGRLVPRPQPHPLLPPGREDLAPAGAAAAPDAERSNSGPAAGAVPQPPRSPSMVSDSTSQAAVTPTMPGTTAAADAAPLSCRAEASSGEKAAAAAAAANEQGDRGRKPRRHEGPSAAARLAALSATFAVSGLMHEVLLWVCTGDASQLGKQTWFFAIQVRGPPPGVKTCPAPLMLVEQQLVRATSRAGIKLPVWLCIPVASLTLQIPAMYGFWGAYFAAVTPRPTPLSAPGAALVAGGNGLGTSIGAFKSEL